MQFYHNEYLLNLEKASAAMSYENSYLWPRTPVGSDIQERIVQRFGVSDYDVVIKHSRPALIIRQIRLLIKQKLVGERFSMLDIACGDGIVLWQIKKTFPGAYCYGIDCNKGKYDTHKQVEQDGVQLFHVYIQQLFTSYPSVPFDVVLMLNTYRGWESADLREHEKNLPGLADLWFQKNARYIILTVTEEQIANLKQLGFSVAKIGKGEENSTMVCISTGKLPQSFVNRFFFAEKRRGQVE